MLWLHNDFPLIIVIIIIVHSLIRVLMRKLTHAAGLYSEDV